MAEWIAYNELEPFGDERADLRAAITSSILANAYRPPKSRSFKPVDFMPFSEKPRQSKAEQVQIARLVSLSVQAKQKKESKRKKK